ncbi:hypothetical protein UT300018_15670 [Clostridium faecium]|uniref:Uncharacterized protein n=1 Tax=Clostridium faecium TaxID=2762223 RepID=A0ABR8YR77_9CLOT|nr:MULTISPECIES: hypothetical protein [Clostridium]MBD8046755.1 hypothetical protein [Clostridium faecium]
MTKKEINHEVKFTKEQIINSSKFTQIEKDILKALLDDKQYSLEEVKNIIDDFNKKEVK